MALDTTNSILVEDFPHSGTNYALLGAIRMLIFLAIYGGGLYATFHFRRTPLGKISIAAAILSLLLTAVSFFGGAEPDLFWAMTRPQMVALDICMLWPLFFMLGSGAWLVYVIVRWTVRRARRKLPEPRPTSSR